MEECNYCLIYFWIVYHWLPHFYHISFSFISLISRVETYSGCVFYILDTAFFDFSTTRHLESTVENHPLKNYSHFINEDCLARKLKLKIPVFSKLYTQWEQKHIRMRLSQQHLVHIKKDKMDFVRWFIILMRLESITMILN